MLFNPIIQWWRKGPISGQIHRFLWSKAPIHYKISMLACKFCSFRVIFLILMRRFSRHVLVLCVISPLSSYRFDTFDRRNCRLNNNLHYQLCSIGLPVPRGRLLHAQFRDLADNYCRLLGLWDNWIHAFGI